MKKPPNGARIAAYRVWGFKGSDSRIKRSLTDAVKRTDALIGRNNKGVVIRVFWVPRGCPTRAGAGRKRAENRNDEY